MLKQAIRRVYPGFSESYYGYRSFSDLLEDIKKKGLIELEFEEGPRQLQSPPQERRIINPTWSNSCGNSRCSREGELQRMQR